MGFYTASDLMIGGNNPMHLADMKVCNNGQAQDPLPFLYLNQGKGYLTFPGYLFA
jgi:hypothetical protein